MAVVGLLSGCTPAGPAPEVERFLEVRDARFDVAAQIADVFPDAEWGGNWDRVHECSDAEVPSSTAGLEAAARSGGVVLPDEQDAALEQVLAVLETARWPEPVTEEHATGITVTSSSDDGFSFLLDFGTQGIALEVWTECVPGDHQAFRDAVRDAPFPW